MYNFSISSLKLNIIIVQHSYRGIYVIRLYKKDIVKLLINPNVVKIE